jgi:hypothetical protein
MTSSTDTWTITKNPQSLPILISGTMVENSNATLQCNSPDSQKKEGPTTPTPTPTGTPQSR